MKKLTILLTLLLIAFAPVEAQQQKNKTEQKTEKKADKKTEKKADKKDSAKQDKKKESAKKDDPKKKKLTRKERIQQKKEQLKKKAAELKVKAKEKAADLKVKAQETAEDLKEKAEDAKVKADSILDERNAKITTDTLWVARPKETWIFRLKTDGVGEQFHIRATDATNGQKLNYFLANDPKITVGLMANYRGISLALSFSPSKILSDISDMVSAINYYSNTFGIDLTYENIDKFRGRTSMMGSRRKLNNTDLERFTVGGYYVFNGKKFSLPAVFNSTWEQKRSAGSFLVQATFDTGRLKIGDDIDPDNTYSTELNKVNINSFSIGAGYGYNLVVGKHWLFHLTAQPSIMLWHNYKMRYTEGGKEETKKMPSGLNVFAVGRLGAIYSWDKYFIGTTAVVQTSKAGKDSEFSLESTNWQGRVFFGLKF